MPVILRAENLIKRFPTPHGQVTGVADVSLTVDEGEFLSTMGPSGSGKSTLISLLGVIDRPSAGRVLLRNRDVFQLNERDMLELRRFHIGFMFQAFYLLQHLTAMENVMLPLGFQKDLDRPEREQRALQMLSEVGLEHRANHYPRQLSGGEQQRVAIARALVNHPEILLADEPTGNLDTTSTHFILELVQKFNQRGQTIVVVTHNPVFVDYSHRVIHMRDGRLVQALSDTE